MPLIVMRVKTLVIITMGIAKGNKMVTINKNNNGYMNGDLVRVIGYEKKDNLTKFVYLEGHLKGKVFFQPAESVNYTNINN